ncbi:MAG: hypothetical protein JO263_10605, partial [Candidatus Eremiobacteraeota bacterium]|nr:hypothetical protein [Candidatus Eremiobacteraeota bacterium]
MRCALFVLAAAVAFASASTTARAVATGDPQAQALLEKHRVFVGWQFGDGTFRTMR